MPKRTFIALPVPASEKLIAETEFYRNNLEGLNVKWVEYKNLHITLAFLGDTSDDQITAIRQHLPSVVSGYSPFSLLLTCTGAFKSPQNPQVIWIGMEPAKTLDNLYRDIQQFIGNMGFERDNRPFRPHLTIGRIKGAAQSHNLPELIKLSEGVNEKVITETIIFYESMLQPAGPVYKPIEVFNLKE